MRKGGAHLAARSRVALLAALLVAAVGAVFAQESAPGTSAPGPGQLGAQTLYVMKDLTVVYPAGRGEPAALNRASAEHRASYLEMAHGVEVRVRSDVEITEEEKKGNLLVLGWQNRLLGPAAAPSPFERTATGLDFLGVVDRTPLSDLLFVAASPYNPEHFLFFWSRIDPELDRFMVLPGAGSDWAIYDDYLIVRQGMFQAERSWPPRRNLEAEADHETNLSRFREGWKTKRTDHYLVHYDPKVVSPSQLESMVSAREKAYARAATDLGGLDTAVRISLHIYKDEELKRTMTGVPDAAHSLPRSRKLHLTLRYAAAASAHEETHILAYAKWGPCYLTTLYEGLAVAAERSYGGMEIAVQAALMLEAGVFPDLDVLLDEERGRALGEKIRWPASGLLVTWLRQGFGDRWAKAYGVREGTVESLAGTLGSSPETLGAGFRAWVESTAEARSDDVAFLDAQQAAQQRYTAGDYEGVITALVLALEHRPSDTQTIFNLASARMRTGDYDGAEKDLSRVLELDTDPKSRFVVFGHYQLGRLLDIQGRRDDALAHYRAMLELPDQHEAHRLAREAIETPVTAEELK